MELSHLIDNYGQDIYGFCYKLTGDRYQADDLYQETFLKATELCHKMDKDKSEEGSNSMEHDDVELLLEGATLIPESVQEIVPDKQGIVTYEFNNFETRTPVEVLFDKMPRTLVTSVVS